MMCHWSWKRACALLKTDQEGVVLQDGEKTMNFLLLMPIWRDVLRKVNHLQKWLFVEVHQICAFINYFCIDVTQGVVVFPVNCWYIWMGPRDRGPHSTAWLKWKHWYIYEPLAYIYITVASYMSNWRWHALLHQISVYIIHSFQNTPYNRGLHITNVLT